jgi:SET family sugar efflux transporter-like MFS transporter
MAFSQQSFGSTFDLFRIPFFASAFLAILFAILAEAMAFSYIAILAVEKIGMTPLELGAFLCLSAISGIVISTTFGHLHDQRPAMWPLLLSLVAKTVGFGLCAVLTETWLLLANAAILFGLSSASFPLLFAITKHHLDHSDRLTISKGMAALRIGSSLSWAVGPALAAALVGLGSLSHLYVGAALMAGLALAVVIFGRIRIVPGVDHQQPVTADVVRAAAPVALALMAFHTAMFIGANATAIVVAQQLGSLTDVGLLSSLCAMIEIALMSVFLIRPVSGQKRRLLIFGFLVFSIYFSLPILWPDLSSLYVGQLFRAGGIAIISVLGMAYLQDLLPGRSGMAAALFTNTSSAGLLLSGIGTGLLAQSFNYWSLFACCIGLCLAGGTALLFARGDS